MLKQDEFPFAIKSILSSLVLPAVLITLAPLAYSGPLQEAAINQIVNDVKVIDPAKGARTAAVKDIIRDNLAVRTGIQSRTELLFQDDTLTRLGAETVFSFKAGTRDLNLDRGTMLLQVPKNHGGARIRTASVTASITGTTILMEYLPEKSLKVVVLEGSLRLSPNGRLGGSVNIGTTTMPVTNSITVDRPISASTGANGTGALNGGSGGTVSLVAKGTIAVNSTVKVSDSALLRASTNGGNITLSSLKNSGTAISIGNTGQLLSLLSATATGTGGKIQFSSAGGDILVSGGTVTADRGSVDLRNNIVLNNANLRGDVVKVGALGANGQLLIGGGTINADTTLNLYGGTSNGSVRFTGNTTLSGAAAKNIAGKAVTIDDGRTVTIGGRAARVFTDNANYTGSGGNGSTTGNFGGSGATTQAFNKSPNF